MDNFIYNFGDVFDSLRDGVLFFASDTRGVDRAPYEAGYAFGNGFYYILVKNNV